jgi:tRNA-binding EMAP/Myf-like protein
MAPFFFSQKDLLTINCKYKGQAKAKEMRYHLIYMIQAGSGLCPANIKKQKINKVVARGMYCAAKEMHRCYIKITKQSQTILQNVRDNESNWTGNTGLQIGQMKVETQSDRPKA